MVDAPAASAVITVDLPRFGSCTYNEADIFVFPWGLPGFDELRSFVVIQLPAQDHIFWLQSLEDLNIALPLGDPFTFFPDYDPKIPNFARLSLDLQNPEDFTILAVMVGTDGGGTFMNLMAPIIVNLKNHMARQVPLESGGYTVAMKIPVPDVLAQLSDAVVAEAVASAEATAKAQAEAVPD
jgi:flagellar assembly factor FliW